MSSGLNALAGRRLTLTLTSTSATTIRLRRHGVAAPRLRLTVARQGGVPSLRPPPGVGQPPMASLPVPLPTSPSAGPPGTGPGAGPPFLTHTEAIWVSASELASRPTSGTAWNRLKSAADGSLGTPAIADQDSDHDVNTLAAALVFARTGTGAYRTKVAGAIAGAIGTEAGGRTLALGRNLASYVIAADLIGLATHDPGLEAHFRTMAGGSRIAVALYLNDQRDLDRAAAVLRGFLGDRGAHAGFQYGELSWHADPARPVGVNAPGTTKSGFDVDGALPDDMRRGCAFTLPPCATGYPWEAMQGVLVQAELLSRHGHGAYGWSDNAIWRAAAFLERTDLLYGGWWASANDAWQPWVLNHAYTSALRTAAAGSAGKILGWTDWVYGG